LDWDDIAWRITGPEGGLRYFRMGIVLVVLGIVALAAVGFTPIHMSGETSLTYDMMAEEPDSEEAFGVPNSHALGHANWAMVGATLTILVGIVLILEGKRIINLRRLLVWHAEARATALFAVAAICSSIGLFAGASLMGLVESVTSSITVIGPGVSVDVEVNAVSPAAIIIVLTLGIATAGMVGMAYYNAVLSVYRGGGEPLNRRMARSAMLLVLLSLLGILVLRSGTIMTAEIVMVTTEPEPAEVVVYVPYTMSRIDYQATLGAGEETKGLLDWQLTLASTFLFLAAMAGMGGLVGCSARSLGGTSRKVRFAAALPAAGVLFVGLSVLLLAWASSTAPAAARESWNIDNLDVPLGWGLLLGAIIALGTLVSGLGYVSAHGIAPAKEALMLWRRPEVEPEAAEEGIPQPMVDQALEEEARARGEFPPVEPEAAPTPPLRERILLKDARRNQLVIAAVLIALIILVAVFWTGGPVGNGGNGGPDSVVIEELPEFSWDVSSDEYLQEGEDLLIDPFVVIRDNPGAAIFVNSVTVTVTWTDEPDAGILWTNQPDSFTALVDDDHGIDTASSSGENPQGGQGRVVAVWSTGSAWVVTGNPELVEWGDQEVYENVLLEAGAVMDRAGDQVTLLGRTQNDPGNAYLYTISIEGRQYSPP
jgi:hypothetical protein